jgi:DNA modification methylase
MPLRFRNCLSVKHLAAPKINAIYCGDCAEVLHQYIPDKSVDLIYADPPFFSNQQYEVLWGDGYELRAFADRWKGGIQNYIAWMEPKLRECFRVLKDTGSMYLHCDWHAGHYLKIEMDKIFGEKQIQNDLVWKRTSAHTGEGKITRYGTVHDNILFYTKTDKHTFNPQYLPYEEQYVDKFYSHKDKDGRRWMSDNLTAAGIRHGETGKPWRGIDPTKKGNHWKYPPSKLEELAKAGHIQFPKKPGGVPRYKRYLDEVKGLLIQDIWVDITPVQAHAKERLGYPTQKPESLLERIIRVSSNPMDIVLDPFCGCGTALAVAQRLGRRWVGIDVSPTACKLMASRMRKLSVSIQEKDIIGLPKTIDEIKEMQPFEFQNWVMQKLMARISKTLSTDMGIDGWTLDNRPIQVKQSEAVGRNVIDNFETALQRANKKSGVIVALSFGKGAYEEVARAKLEQGLEIELKTVSEILDER